ncbi:MAG: hypothetical protein KDE20_09650, partial [Caldilineaceae bacterium]|nr:hypothetical protein [Caldilineaceae bacterium]
REGEDLDQVRADLALELSDLQVMLFKIAYLCGIDMEEAMVRGQHKADARFPDPADGPAERTPVWLCPPVLPLYNHFAIPIRTNVLLGIDTAQMFVYTLGKFGKHTFGLG